MTQAQVAAKVGIPPQYVSDIKRGRRPMTELVARRFAEEFGVSFQWLLGVSNESGTPPRATGSGGAVWLPLFPHPIEGEPRTHEKWDGVGIEVAGVAAGKLAMTTWPYVLRFNHDDVEGRLKKGDLILVSQVPRDEAEIHVIRHKKKSFLARANDDDTWRRVANGETMSNESVVTGHCLGIIWGSLT